MELHNINSEFMSVLMKDNYTEEDIALIDRFTNDEKEKINQLAGYVANIESDIQAINNAIYSMTRRGNRLLDKSERLRQIIVDKMEKLQIDHLSNPCLEIRLTTNALPSVDIIDETVIPEPYFARKEVMQIDRQLIASDVILRNVDVPGVKVYYRKNLTIE